MISTAPTYALVTLAPGPVHGVESSDLRCRPERASIGLWR